MARLKRATARVALLALAVGSAVGAGALVASAASGTVTLTLAGDHTYVAGEQVELGIAYSDTSFSGVAELQRWDEGNAAWDSILEYDMVDGVVADFLYIRDGLGEPEQVRAVVDGTPSDAITVTREAFESSVTGDMDLLPGDESFLGITTNADYMDGPANVYTWDEATDTWLIYDEVTMGGGVGAFQPDPWRARSYMVGFYEETGEFENFFSDRFDVEVWFENPYVEWDPEFYYGESVYADLHWGGFGTSDVVTLQYYVEPVGSTAGYWTNSALGSVVSVDGYTHVEWQAAGTTQYRFRVSHLDGPEVDLDPFTMVLIPSDVVAVPDAASIPANTPAGATVTVEPAPATGTARIQYLNGDVWTTFGPVITLTDGTGHVAWNPGTSEFTYRFVYWTSYSDPFEVGIVFPTVTGTPDAASIPPMTPAGATVTVDPAPASGTARIQYLNRGIWTTFGPEIALTDGTGHVTWNPGTSEFTYRFVYGNYISDTFTVGILAPTVTGVPDAASIPPGSPAGATVTVDPAPTTGTARIQYLNGSTWTTFGPIITLTGGTGHVTWNPGTSEFTYRFIYGSTVSDTFTVGIQAPTVTGTPDAAEIPAMTPAGATVTVDPAPTTGTARIQYLNGSTWTTFGPIITLTGGTGHVEWNPGTSTFTYRFIYGSTVSDTFTVGILAPTVTGTPDAASIPPMTPAGATVTVDPAPTGGTAQLQYLKGSTWTTFGPIITLVDGTGHVTWNPGTSTFTYRFIYGSTVSDTFTVGIQAPTVIGTPDATEIPAWTPAGATVTVDPAPTTGTARIQYLNGSTWATFGPVITLIDGTGHVEWNPGTSTFTYRFIYGSTVSETFVVTMIPTA